MQKDNAYIIVYDWMLQMLGSSTACNLYALMYSFKDEQGNVQMSQGYMMHRLCSTERMIKYALTELLRLGYITVEKQGRGKGVCTTYNMPAKRIQNCTLIDNLKGDKNVPFSDTKRVQNCTLKKDTKLYPYNNSFNNSNAQTRVCENMTDYNFSEFWTLFAPADEYQDRKRACVQAWISLTQEQRDEMLAELKQGKPTRQNPLYFLRYHDEGKVVQPVLLTRDEVYKRFRTTEPKGYCILDMQFDGGARWCSVEDAEKNGYPIRRMFA